MRNDELSKIDFSNWPIPDNYLTEVGRVALLWAALENLLNICLGKLAGFDKVMDERAYILLIHSSFPQRLDSFSALCDILKDQYPNLQDYKQVVSKLKAAQKTRNRFMHHSMSLKEETGRAEMSVGSARGSLKSSVEVISIEDIKRASVQIDEAQVALYKLVVQKELPSVLERRRT
jgi:hypothetical protein